MRASSTFLCLGRASSEECHCVQVTDVKQEAVLELSKQIREAQRLQEQRQADAVSQLSLCLTIAP